MSGFPNLAGNAAAVDVIPCELIAARITVYAFTPREDFRSEVPYRHFGFLRGWFFRRAWRYCVVDRHDKIVLPFRFAEPLHESHGDGARCAGDCACRSPASHYPPTRGHLGVDSYHVDDAESLVALVEAIERWSRECAPDASKGYKPSGLELLGRMGILS